MRLRRSLPGAVRPARCRPAGVAVLAVVSVVFGLGGFVSASSEGAVALARSSGTFGRSAGSANPAGWAPGQDVNQLDGPAVSLSCATDTHCVGVDSVGNAFSYNGTAWRGPRNLSEPYLNCNRDCVGPFLEVVRCPTSTFCIAVTDTGQGYVEQDGAWRKGAAWSTAGGPAPALSCTSRDFCMAISRSLPGDTETRDSWYSLFNGSTWTKPAPVPLWWAGSVSCVSSDFCSATSGDGTVSEWTPGGWSAPTQLVARNATVQVSCGGVGRCVAVNSSGATFTLLDGTWTRQPSGPQGLGSPSCPTTSFCAAATFGGGVTIRRGSTWSPVVQLAGNEGLVGLTCRSASFCLAEGESPNHPVAIFSTFDGRAWSSPERAYRERGGLLSDSCATAGHCDALVYDGSVTDDRAHWTAQRSSPALGSSEPSIACPSLGTCVAIGGRETSILRNGRWSRPFEIDWKGDLTALSCSSADFCVAVDDFGRELTWDGRSWSRPHSVDPGGSGYFFAVSCAAQDFCVALDEVDRYVVLSSGHWAAPQPSGMDGAWAISCRTATWCLALTTSGKMSIYRNGTWSSPSSALVLGGSLVGLSCASETFCVATGTDNGEAWIFNGRTWSAPSQLTAVGQLSAPSCPAVGWCLAVDGVGRAYTYRAE